ncbi:MAG: VOC family protein [Gammaproteobacteria bacterium]|nr:VOC family protein [Gammaproteobacteria bacterium]
MTPKLNGIDHVHVYVHSWAEAEEWYQTVMGFKRVDALMPWAVKNGPLTVEDPEGNVHLAFFERDDNPDTSAIAFGTSGEEFLAWKSHLEGHDLELRVTDHKMAYSLYFSDPWGNLHEITTYERDYVAEHLANTGVTQQ